MLAPAITGSAQMSEGQDNALLLHLDLGLLQLINLLADHLHLLKLTSNCMIYQLENISAHFVNQEPQPWETSDSYGLGAAPCCVWSR